MKKPYSFGLHVSASARATPQFSLPSLAFVSALALSSSVWFWSLLAKPLLFFEQISFIVEMLWQ